MLKQSQNPYGYRNLLVYKKAEELQVLCAELTGHFPKSKTLIALADQMDRSARSTKQNITEGWKRNTTNEYYQFLGFAIASNAELEEDCGDIWKGIYPDLMGLEGVMGDYERGERGEKGERGIMGDYERGERGEKGERGIMGEKGEISPLPSLSFSFPFDIESLPFYPIQPDLPPVVQLKLRVKELNFLLDRLQKSLSVKMASEGTLSSRDKLKRAQDRRAGEEKLYENMLREHGLVRLENGRVVKEEEWERGARE